MFALPNSGQRAAAFVSRINRFKYFVSGDWPLCSIKRELAELVVSPRRAKLQLAAGFNPLILRMFLDSPGEVVLREEIRQRL
jgi:hypothetical protein